MKKTVSLLGVILFNLPLFSQVGINTEQPTQTLDVNGNARFRSVPENNVLATTDKVMVLQSDGTAKKVSVESLQPAEKFTLNNIDAITATNPVDIDIQNKTTINNVNIGMSRTVTIPPQTSAMLVLNYSIPLGTVDCEGTNISYYGIRFLKNGSEESSGSRKYSRLPKISSSSMVSVSNTYTENITNNTTNPLNIIYSLNGYIEISGTNATSCNVRFNMWSATGNNFNWGRGNMNIQLFTKPL